MGTNTRFGAITTTALALTLACTGGCVRGSGSGGTGTGGGGTTTATPPWPATATALTQRLTTQQDWNLQTRTGVETASSAGDVKLASLPNVIATHAGTPGTVSYDPGDTTGSRMLLTTQGNGAFLTTDGGANWTGLNLLSSPALPNNVFYCADFFGGDGTGQTFLLGSYGGAHLTRDGGLTFQTFSTNSSPALPSNDVKSVAFFDGDTTGQKFLIATTAGVMWTGDGGTTFTQYDISNTPNLDPYRVVDVDYFKGDTTGKTWLIAARYDNNLPRGGVWVTTTNGAGFTQWTGNSTVPLPGNQVTSACFFQGGTTGNSWMATFDTAWGGAGGLAVTTNGGNSFTVLNSTSSPALPVNDVTCGAFGPSNAHWIAGTPAAGAVVTTSGASGLMPLTNSTTPMLLTNYVRTVAWHGSRAADFAVGTTGGLQTTTDTGLTLTTRTPAGATILPGAATTSVEIFHGDGTGKRILVGGFGGASLSTDGGQSWTHYSTSTTPALPNDNVFAVAWYQGNTTGSHFAIATQGGIVRTTDGGQTFTTITTANGLPNNYVTDLAYFSGSATNTTTLLCATWSGVAYTTNGTTWQTWTTTTTPALPSNNVSCVSFWEGDSTGATWLAGTYYGLVRTTDAGATTTNWTVWDQNSTPALPGNQITSCDFFDGGTSASAFGATVSYFVPHPHGFSSPRGAVLTTDAGQSFTVKNAANGLPNDWVTGINYHSGQSSATHITLGGNYYYNSGLLQSSDGGSTFTFLNSNTSPTVPAGAVQVDYDDSVAGATRLAAALYGAGAILLNGPNTAPTGTIAIGSVDGRLWETTAGTNAVDDGLVRGAAFFDGNATGSRIAVGGRYGLGLSTDGGTTFSLRNPATSPALATAEVRDVDYFSGDTTGNTVLVATDQGAFLTTDGGATFTQFDSTTGLPANDVVDVCFHQGQSTPNRFAVVTTSGVVITTNGGTGFAQPVGSIWGVAREFDFFDGDATGARYCIVTDSHPFHTENGGTTFTARGNTLSAGWSKCVQYYEGDTTGSTWLVGTWNGTSSVGNGGAGLTTDNGATWTVWNALTTPAISSAFVNSVAFFQGTSSSTPTHFAFGLESGEVAVTTNGGSTFTTYGTAAGLPGGRVHAVTYANAFTGGARWMVATDHGIALTTNGGTIFSRLGGGAVGWYDTVNVNATVPAGTSVTVQVRDAGGALIPDSVLAGNSTGLIPDAQGDVPIWSIPVASYPGVRVRVNLATTSPSTGTTPIVHEVTIAFRR